MVLNMSHSDKEKYKKGLEERKITPRKKRATVLTPKAMDLAMKQSKLYDTAGRSGDEDIKIDDHFKMNDNYMRTGPYQPKKK